MGIKGKKKKSERDMKFEKKLAARAISEWKNQYPRYSSLKEVLRVARAGSVEVFWSLLIEDVQRSSHFFESTLNKTAAKVAEASREGDTKTILDGYEVLLKLQNFRDLSTTGFRKIVKKADKVFSDRKSVV